MKIWVLVTVTRGFIDEPRIFYRKKTAKKYYKQCLKNINPDYDEINLFQKVI